MTFEELLKDSRFQEAGVDGQVQAIDRWYEGAKSLNPDQEDELRHEQFLVSNGWEQKEKAKQADEDTKPYHLRQYSILNRMNKLPRDDPRQADLLGELTRTQGALQIEPKLKEDRDNFMAMRDVLSKIPVKRGEVKGPLDALGVFGADIVETAKAAVGKSDAVAADQELGKIRQRLGPQKSKQLEERVQREAFLMFDGDAIKAKTGEPVIKPRLALEDDDTIRTRLKDLGVDDAQIETFMQERLPMIRTDTVQLLRSLREIDKSEQRKKLGDREYALALMKDAEGQNALLSALQGFGANLRGLVGGTASLVGAKDFGTERTKQAAAMNVLMGASGHEFVGQLGGLFPDLALSLIPGGLATKSSRFRAMLGKVPVLRGAGAAGGVATAERAGLAGAALGGGASAGIRTFGEARADGLGWGESFELGLRQMLTTAGVTMAFGSTGVESVFAAGTPARQGLLQMVRSALPEAAKEGAEEATDELLSYFTVQKKIDPEAKFEDTVKNAVSAFKLGAFAGGGVNFAQSVVKNLTAVDPNAADLLDEADPGLATAQEAAKDVYGEELSTNENDARTTGGVRPEAETGQGLLGGVPGGATGEAGPQGDQGEVRGAEGDLGQPGDTQTGPVQPTGEPTGARRVGEEAAQVGQGEGPRDAGKVFQRKPGVLYHGSAQVREDMQPGSMLTSDPSWAVGYTTTVDTSKGTLDEEFTGAVHEVEYTPQNPLEVEGWSVSKAEDELLRRTRGMERGGTLRDAAKALHAAEGFDAIVVRTPGGEVGGMIPLVTIPVSNKYSPQSVIEGEGVENQADNIRKAYENVQQGIRPDEGQQGQAPQELGQTNQEGDGQPQVQVPEQDAVGQGTEVGTADAPPVEPVATEAAPEAQVAPPQTEQPPAADQGGVTAPVEQAAARETIAAYENQAVQDQVQEAGGLPPVQGEPTQAQPEGQAQEGAAQREGEGAAKAVAEAESAVTAFQEAASTSSDPDTKKAAEGELKSAKLRLSLAKTDARLPLTEGDVRAQAMVPEPYPLEAKNIPEGYVREGDLYVYREPTLETPETQTAAPEPSPEAPPRQPDQNLTGIKFEALDKELKDLGYEKGIARRPAGTNQEAFDAARAQFEAEVPEGEMDAGTKLIDDLIREPRGWKDEVELNLARLEIFRRKAEMGRAAKAMFTAKSNKLSKEDQRSLRSLYDGAELRLNAAMRAAAYAQSTWGKTGRVSQDWLAEDFTLVDLATRWRAVVNNGAPLTDGTNGTPNQAKEVADAYEKIKQQQAQLAMLEEALENATEENKDLVASMDLLVADVERAQKKGSRSEKLRKDLDTKAAEARARIEARRQGPPPEEGDTTVLAAGLTPETAQDIKDYAIIGASYLAKKFVGLGEFTSRMVQEFGEKILPLVSRVYRESLALYNETYSSVRGEDTNPEPEAIVDGIDPDEGPTKRDVWALARAHVIRGLRGDNVLNAVHSDLQESFPDLTRDEVAKLFTGYGTVIYPSKEETEVELNKLRNLERIVLKRKDVLRGKVPERTGFQRGEQDVEVREAEREFRRLLKESGLQTTDEATQLRTALGAAKRRMQNEIEAYEKAIAENKKRSDTGRSTLEYDEEATQLKSKLEEVRSAYNEIFREGPTMEQRQQALIKDLDRRIAEEEQMIKDGVFARPKGEPVLETPEIAARRERLAELRAQRRRLDPSQTPLAQAKAATERSIERLREMLKTGEVAVKERRTVDPDDELRARWEVKQALQDEVRELRRMLPGSPAQERAQIERALKASEASARRIEEKLRTGDLSVKPKRETAASRNAAVQAARARVKELNKELARRRREALPKKSPEEIRVNRALSSLRRQKKELERRIAQNDFSPRAKPKPVNDQRVRDAREEVEKLKREVNTKMLEAKLAQRNAAVKLFAGGTDAIFRLPRAIQTSIDAGAFGRQGWLAWLAHPAVTSKQFGKNFAFTEKRAAKAEQELEDNPLYQTALDAGLSLTSWRPGHSFAEMEEMYRSRIARKVPGVVQSERSYVTYLNAVRMAHFELLYKALEAKEGGLDADGVNLKKIARHINSMTGRGNLGSWERAAEPLATLLFSPKYWWSRLEMLGGTIYSAADAASGFRLGKDEDLIARKIIAKERGRIALGLTAMYSLIAAAASMLGDDEEPEATITFNPLTTDFGKIKFSNGTRIDPGAGLLQNIVFPMQMAFGKRISSVTGDEIDFAGDDKTGRQTRLSESGRMFRKKLAPVPSTVADLWDEKDILGRPVLPESEAVGMFIPISMSEAYESYTDLGLSKGTAATLLNLFGFGTSTYGGSVQEAVSLERRGAELVGGILGLPPERYDRFHKKQ